MASARGLTLIGMWSAGSEAYQETTVKALARQFGAKLLIFDNTAISPDVSKQEHTIVPYSALYK